MNKKRVLVPILLVLATVLGFAAVTLTSRPKGDVKQEQRIAKTDTVEKKLGDSEKRVETDEGGGSPGTTESEDVTDSPDRNPGTTAKGDQPSGAKPGQARQEPRRAGSAMQLIQMTRGIAELEKNEAHRLTAKQAGQLLEILTPLRSKPKLTEEDAAKALNALKRVFTTDQLNLVTQMRPRRPIRERPDRPNSDNPPPRTDGTRNAPPAGPPPPPPGNTGTRPRFDPDTFRDFNPFYSKALTESAFEQERVKRVDDFFAMLAERAKRSTPTTE